MKAGIMTEPKYDFLPEESGENVTRDQLRAAVRGGAGIERAGGSRFAHIRQGASVRLYADGAMAEFDGGAAQLAVLLSDRAALTSAELAPFLDDDTCCGLVSGLVNAGSLRLVR